MIIKSIKYIAVCLFLVLACLSCEETDNEKEWGFALVYMPQANYEIYNVPNSGSDIQLNKNYAIDSVNMKLNVYLGVYRSGLQKLESYSVSVSSDTITIEDALLLPVDKYSLPTSVTCEDGKRDQTFYLEVDLDFLANNQANDYSLAVSISDPSKYELNEELTTTRVLIKPSDLFK